MENEQGWIYKGPMDPIINLIKNHVCERCGKKGMLCDCWVEEIICENCKNKLIECTCKDLMNGMD